MRLLNHTKTAVLLAALMVLLMAIGYYLGGSQGVMLGFAFGLMSNGIAYFFSDKIALLAMGAREVSREELPWLHDMVERLAARAGLPKPRVCVSSQAAPNAFATGRNPRNAVVCVTHGMLGFPREELEGVIAHELAHVRHYDMLISTVAAVIAGAISYLGYILMWTGGGHRDDDRGGSPLGAIGAIAMIILAPLAAALIQMAISRQREYAADSYGGELSGNPENLARALVRLQSYNERVPVQTNPAFNNLYIVEPFSGSSIASLFSTHPPVEKRVAALQEQANRMQK
jgi:heat shock protein HtpX